MNTVLKHTILDRTIVENEQVLNRLANKFSSDPLVKEELVQETFVRSLKSIQRFIGHPKLVSWLYVIMKNIYFNQYRRQNVRRKAEKDMQVSDMSARTQKNNAESKFIVDDIQKMILTLSEENYIIFTMYAEGYKYHEIAKYLNINEGTIKTRIHTIRKSLRAKLKVYSS